MIAVDCVMCEEELEQPGGLLISPPEGKGKDVRYRKLHICRDCFVIIEGFTDDRVLLKRISKTETE